MEMPKPPPLSWMNFGEDEMGMGCGTLVWDPISYPLFGKDNKLTLEEDYFFWRHSCTLLENTFYKCPDEPYITLYEVGSASGPGRNDREEEEITAGTITPYLQELNN